MLRLEEDSLSPPELSEEADSCSGRRPGADNAGSAVVVVPGLTQDHEEILMTLGELYKDLFNHDGYGQMQVEIRFLKKKQKEVIIRCGKDYRFVVDFHGSAQR